MPWLPVRQRWWWRRWWWWWRKRRGKNKTEREKGKGGGKGEGKGKQRRREEAKKGGEKRQKGRNWGTWRSVNEARVKNRNDDDDDDDDDDDTIHQHQQLVLVAMQVEQLRLLCIHWSHVHYSFSRDAAAPARVCVAPPIIDADPRLLVPGVRPPGRRRRRTGLSVT